VTLDVESGGKSEQLKADVCIVAIGIVANTDGIGLEALGVELERGKS
jgi:dihydrolipoamide dehydrogenase